MNGTYSGPENLPIEALSAYGELLPYLGATIVLVAIIGFLYKIGVEEGWIE